MSKKMDITDETNENELEEELEGEEDLLADDEGEEEEEKPKRRPTGDAPASKADIREVRSIVEGLKNQVQGGSKEDKKEVSELDKLLVSMLENGADKNQVAGLLAVATAITKDLEKKGESKEQETLARSLNQRVLDEIDGQLDKYEKEYGEVIGIGREQLGKRVLQRMRDSDKYASARAQYEAGRKPSAGDFQRATAEVVETFLKKAGIKKSANPANEQLDLGSSRSRPTKVTTDKGKIDVATLAEDERDAYYAAKNITKNDDVAIDAVMTLRRAKRGARA